MIIRLFSIVNDLKKSKVRGWSLLYKINKLIVNIVYPVAGLFHRGSGVDENSEIIISLTSFPDRIPYIWVTILTLLNQTKKPYKVVLWLAKEQFPDEKVPGSLMRLKKRGLDIRFCDDLKSHKKYYYTMKTWPDKYVVICDDDMFYPENLIEKLWDEYEKNPGCIICNSSIEVTYDEEGNIIKRGLWKHESKKNKGLQVSPIGCDGVLYPPGSLDEEVFHKSVLKELALGQDDIWLKCMAVRKGTPAYNGGSYAHDFFNNLFTQGDGLWKTNLKTDGSGSYTPNETAWMNILEKYPDIEVALKEDKRRENSGC